MFCGKCGAKNDDGAKFCSSCGESIQIGGVKSAALKPNHRLIGIIAVVLVAAIVLVSGIGLLGGRSAEDTADLLIEALMALDLVKVHELYPEPIQEWLPESYGVTAEEYIQSLVEKNEELQMELGLYGSEVKWRNAGLTDVSEESISSLKELYQRKGVTISGAKTMTVEISVEVWGIEQSEQMSLLLIKHKGSWYVDYYSFGDLL